MKSYKYVSAVWSAKRILFLFVLLSYSLYGFTQVARSRRRENFDVNLFDVKTIAIPAPDIKLTLPGIGAVTVVDARGDTGRIGFTQKKIVKVLAAIEQEGKEQQRIAKRPTFLRLGNSVRQDLQQFVNDYLVLPGGDSLPRILMVVKKLWLSDELNLGKEENKKTNTEHVENWTSGVAAKFEFYVQQGNDYYALYRYDSTISKALTISEYGPEFLALAMQLSLAKMHSMANRINNTAGRTKFSLDQINAHNALAYQLPVLTDSVLNAGVYLSFEEFKNNQPSHKNFSLKKEKLADFLYLKQADGKETVARNVWGYCNGKNAFVKAGDNFFLLQRLENTFYIFGTKNLDWQSYGGVSPTFSPNGQYYYNSTNNTAEGYGLQLRPFQLDWDSGKLN